MVKELFNASIPTLILLSVVGVMWACGVIARAKRKKFKDVRPHPAYATTEITHDNTIYAVVSHKNNRHLVICVDTRPISTWLHKFFGIVPHSTSYCYYDNTWYCMQTSCAVDFKTGLSLTHIISQYLKYAGETEMSTQRKPREVIRKNKTIYTIIVGPNRHIVAGIKIQRDPTIWHRLFCVEPASTMYTYRNYVWFYAKTNDRAPIPTQRELKRIAAHYLRSVEAIK